VRLDDRFVGTAYGVLDDESKEALETMARMEGMVPAFHDTPAA
jgi:1-aminocyclopropane-1-carboxylate deaminase